MSWECAGFAREHATLVDQVQFLARILSAKAVGSAVGRGAERRVATEDTEFTERGVKPGVS